MRTPKRSIIWNPKVGDAAIVPGGPAAPHYLASLTAVECASIKAGRGGYYPPEFRVVPFNDGHLKPGELSFRFQVDYKGRNEWMSNDSVFGNCPFHWPSVIRALNTWYGWGEESFKIVAETDYPEWIKSVYEKERQAKTESN